MIASTYRLLFLDWRVCAVVLGSISVLSTGLARVEMDNGISRWLRESEEHRQDFVRFQSLFGVDDFLLLMVKDVDRDDGRFREALAALERDLESQLPPHLFLSAFPPPGRDSDETMDDSPSSPLDIEETLSGIGSLLSNREEKAAAVLLIPLAERFVRDHVVTLRRLSARHMPGRKWYLGGPAVFNDAISALGEKNQAKFYPWVVVFLSAGVLLVFRSLVLSATAMISMGLCVTGTFGLAGWLGERIDLVSSSLPPLLMVITLTSSIHLLKAWQRFGGSTRKFALARAFRETWTPSLLASCTTAFAFSTFATSEIPALSSVGILAPCGVLIGWAGALSLPALLDRFSWYSCPPAPSHPKAAIPAMKGNGGNLLRADVRSRRTIVATLVCLFLACLTLGNLSFESNPLQFFEREHPLSRSYRQIEEHLLGLSPIEVVVRERNAMSRRFAESVEDLKKPDAIAASLSGADFAIADPARIATLERPSVPLDVLSSRYTDPTGEFQRITLFAKTLGSRDYQNLLEKIESILHRRFKVAEVESITGLVPMIVRAQEYLLRSQFRGLLWVALLVFLLTAFNLRSFWQSVMTMVPNLTPVVFLLGLLSLTKTSIDIGTIMVANVTLGIAIDDTYHFLCAWGRARKRGMERYSAIRAAKRQVGGALVGTTVANSLGFMVLTLSEFPPMRNFGGLVAVGLWLALATDWFLLPPLLAVCRPRLRMAV